MTKVLFEDDSSRLRLEVHAEPPAGSVDLLRRTVWGTGSVRYAMLDMDARLASFRGSHFLALTEADEVVGAVVLAPRTLYVNERALRGLYSTLLAVSPEHTRGGLGALLVREARRHFLEEATEPTVMYGFIEAQNAGSLTVSSRAGGDTWGQFVATVFSRLSARSDGRLTALPPAEKGAMAARLVQRYAGHTHWDFHHSLRPDEYFVVRRGSEVVAGAQARVHHWRFEHLHGLSGLLARDVLPRLPLLGRLMHPDSHHFLFIGNLFAQPGHERELVRLLEGLLAHHGVHTAMLYLDPRSPLYGAIARSGGYGPLHAFGLSAGVQLMARAAHVPAADLEELRRRPLCLSMADDV